jgi:hypothetical protein
MRLIRIELNGSVCNSFDRVRDKNEKEPLEETANEVLRLVPGSV